jgi:hypothetical protein
MRFQVLTAASRKFRVFLDVLPCSQIDVDRLLEVRAASIIRATSAAHPIRFDLICLMISGDEYKLLSSSLYVFLHSPVTSSLVGPNILLRTLFSNTLSLCSSLSVTDQVSHPYKTSGRITLLYVLTFTFLDSRRDDKRP